MNKGISPQAPEVSHFAQKYIPDCDPNTVFLLPANFIKKPNSKSLRKQNRAAAGAQAVFNNLICGIKEIVKPQPSKQNAYRHSFYEPPENSTDSQLSLVKRSATPEPIESRSNGKMSANKFPSSISSPNLAKQDSDTSSSTSNRQNTDLINFSEDFGRGIEEREKRMEERRAQAVSRGSSGSSGNGEARTPKSKKRTLQLPSAPNRDIKPSTILRLEDRDLVVIDKHDIKEAVNNESQVIIVDPPALQTTPTENEHVDLGDILGGQWPELAGGAGSMLNADKKSGALTGSNGWRTIERNKSANIASHFSNSKPRRSDGFESGYDKNTLKKSELKSNHSFGFFI